MIEARSQTARVFPWKLLALSKLNIFLLVPDRHMSTLKFPSQRPSISLSDLPIWALQSSCGSGRHHYEIVIVRRVT